MDKPVRLDLLPDLFPDVEPANWKPLLQSAMFHLVLFPAIDRKSLDVIVGIWPELAKTGKPVPAPIQSPDRPVSSFQAPLLIEDMTALLVACAADPPKLRGGDNGLYTNSVKAITPSLAALPEWLSARMMLSPDSRLAKARSRCTDLGLTKIGGTYGDLRLEITDKGRKWLSVTLGKRTQAAWDAIIGHVSEHMPELTVHYKETIVSTYIVVYSTVSRRTDFTDDILNLFRDLPDDTWHNADELFTYWRTMKNPFLDIYRKDPNARISVSYAYSHGNTTERLQQDWQKVLVGFLDTRLFPFGGAAYGRDGAGRLMFSITPTGRYYLGQSAEFVLEEQLSGRIIVQPNFEIMFLGPSPAAEAELGRFAERRGRGVGVLFQITRKSIYGAAALGMNADGVIETLDRLTAKSMPENVRREVRGWFAQTRRVRFEPTVLIHCQDEQVAARVIGLAKGAAKAITPTILQYRDHQRQQSALMKKLREQGVLVDTGPAREPEPEDDEAE